MNFENFSCYGKLILVFSINGEYFKREFKIEMPLLNTFSTSTNKIIGCTICSNYLILNVNGICAHVNIGRVVSSGLSSDSILNAKLFFEGANPNQIVSISSCLNEFFFCLQQRGKLLSFRYVSKSAVTERNEQNQIKNSDLSTKSLLQILTQISQQQSILDDVSKVFKFNFLFFLKKK